MKNNELNPNIKPKFITITQHHQQNPIAQIHQTSERVWVRLVVRGREEGRAWQTVGNSSRKERQTVNTFIYYDIKKFKEDIEIEICSYSPITFLHRHRHIVQTSCKKEHTEDRTMLFFSFLFFEKKKGELVCGNHYPMPHGIFG